jgi:hypothetical protein
MIWQEEDVETHEPEVIRVRRGCLKRRQAKETAEQKCPMHFSNHVLVLLMMM